MRNTFSIHDIIAQKVYLSGEKNDSLFFTVMYCFDKLSEVNESCFWKEGFKI